MNKNYIPFACATSIYDIEISFYKKLGVKTILIDLDNTLDSHKVELPSERAKEFVKTLKENKIDLIIVSNNFNRRVKAYADALGIHMTSMNLKPFPFKINRLLKEKGLKKEETILIGDQLLTDILAGNRAGLKTILVDPLTTDEQNFTRIRRIFERPKLKKLRDKKLLRDWRTINE